MTGCVATAMSQAMKYHNWPAIGQGSNSYTWDNGNRVLTADFSQMSFNWSDMTDTYNRSTSTEAQQTAVATLMKAAGYSVNMNYSPSASGAASIYIAPALGNNFRYDKSLSYLMRDWFSLPEWEDLIYTSLQTYGPVIYDGQSTGEATRSFATATAPTVCSTSTGAGVASATVTSYSMFSIRTNRA